MLFVYISLIDDVLCFDFQRLSLTAIYFYVFDFDYTVVWHMMLACKQLLIIWHWHFCSTFTVEDSSVMVILLLGLFIV